MPKNVTLSRAELEEADRFYREGGLRQMASPHVHYHDSTCPHFSCEHKMEWIDFQLEPFGDCKPLVRAWWEGTGFAGRCPACHGWIHFTTLRMKAVTEEEAALLPRLPDTWHALAQFAGPLERESRIMPGNESAVSMNKTGELRGVRAYRRVLFVAGAAACVVFLIVAYCWGPYSQSSSEDPVTGRRVRSRSWLGITISRHIEENEVSKWADQHTIPELSPLYFGWGAGSCTQRSEWFGFREIGCGGHRVPEAIFRERIKIEGLTREQILQWYQSELLAAFRQGELAWWDLQRKWADKW